MSSRTLLHELLQRPIAYHRSLAKIGGGACAGLLLSQAWYWTPRTSDSEGWFYKTQEQWEEETGLTRREQETARERLKKRGLLEEKRAGVPAKLYFRVNAENLSKLLTALCQSRMDETAILECTKPPDKNEQNRQTITETTSQTTTETKPPPVASVSENHTPPWLDGNVWQRWLKFRKEIRKPIVGEQYAAQFRLLDKFRLEGMKPEDVIEQSIANGWQGLFALNQRRQTQADFNRGGRGVVI